MSSKRIHWFEISIVTIVIILLLVYSIPRFLHSQYRGKYAAIKGDIQTVLNALAAYQVDYSKEMKDMHSLRNNIIFPCQQRHPNQRQLWNGALYQGIQLGARSTLKLRNYPLLRRYLKDIGYINETGDDSNLNDNPQDINFYILQELHFNSNPDHAVTNVYTGVAVPWPYMDEQYKARLNNLHLMPDDMERSQHTLLKTELYFHPSNGMNSFGFVAVDTIRSST